MIGNSLTMTNSHCKDLGIELGKELFLWPVDFVSPGASSVLKVSACPFMCVYLRVSGDGWWSSLLLRKGHGKLEVAVAN